MTFKCSALTGLRILLGGIFILYATVKFLGIQFTRLHLDQNIDQVDPISLVWYFFGYSQPYILFIACGELVAGVLTAIPKTTKLGVLLYFPFALNITAINWCFELPMDVKILSTFLAFSSFCLIINDLATYKKLLLEMT